MPVEFLQQEPSGGSSHATCLVMMYDGSGRRISKTLLTRASDSQGWDTTLVTHYTGIGTEIRENYAGPTKQTKVVVNMPVFFRVTLTRLKPRSYIEKDILRLSNGGAILPKRSFGASRQGLGRYGIENADGMAKGDEFYLKNHLGSTMMVAQVSSTNASEPAKVAAAYDYRAFGEQVTLKKSADKVTENFTGKEKDDETELNYFGARYLDPMLGVWTSVDPARQFASPYLYVGNGYNPVNGVDPDGNEYWDDFNSPRAARDDFKKIYNTKSINENVEYATMFYETKRIGKDGKIASTYSYTKPNRGTIDRVVLDPKLPKDVYDKKHPGRIIEASYPLSNGDAHTHSRGDDGYDWANPSKMDMDNLTTEKGILFRPDGKVLEYDAKGNVNEIDK